MKKSRHYSEGVKLHNRKQNLFRSFYTKDLSSVVFSQAELFSSKLKTVVGFDFFYSWMKSTGRRTIKSPGGL